MKFKASELQLADVVRMDLSPWGVAIVKQIKDKEVTLFRPYADSADVAYSGGVLCRLGVEEMKLPRDDRLFIVLERKGLQ